MKEDIIELIQAEVDGMNTPEAQARLEQLCAADPAVQHELDSAFSVTRVLGRIAERTPSASFYDNVMAALPANPSWLIQPAAPRRSWTSIFALPSRPSLTLAYGLVVGAFAMFAITSVLSTDPAISDVEGLSGTMAPINTQTISEDIKIGDNMVSIISKQGDEQLSVSFNGPLSVETRIRIIVEDGQQVVFDQAYTSTRN
jgi:hypothetical protein